ncbi:energy transducer TonB [Uliginosibacterium sp. sgz301328]|uniref:energy transducer TonB n=1 Tax=Uliginosibacterium sp. sgz301328 TaxID=3243764 RepID=UPI00359E8853
MKRFRLPVVFLAVTILASCAPLPSPPAGEKKGAASDDWSQRIVAAIRPNIVRVADLPGRPTAVFAVNLLPDGTVTAIPMEKGTGNAQQDGLIERAIARASPLPLPRRQEDFALSPRLTFDPNAPNGS